MCVCTLPNCMAQIKSIRVKVAAGQNRTSHYLLSTSERVGKAVVIR